MKNFAIALLFFAPMVAVGQTLEPQIKFNLYFADARGHLDTATIGYDPLAGANVDPQFGEFNLRGVPFDSVFEVRGADKSGYEVQSNPTVQFYHPVWCTEWPWTQYQSVILRAKHWPVRITWDRAYFFEECYDWTLLTRVWDYLFHPDFINGDIVQLSVHDSVLVRPSYLRQTNSLFNHRLEPLVGGGRDTVYVIWVGLAGEPPTVPAHEQQTVHAQVYPNPSGDWISVRLPSDAAPLDLSQIALYDILGRRFAIEKWEQTDNGARLSLEGLPPGVYRGQITAKGQANRVFSFVRL